MELFYTHFVYFGQALAVSGLKMLVISYHYLQVVKSQPYPNCFQDTWKWKQTSNDECTHQMELLDIYFVYFGQASAVQAWKR